MRRDCFEDSPKWTARLKAVLDYRKGEDYSHSQWMQKYEEQSEQKNNGKCAGRRVCRTLDTRVGVCRHWHHHATPAFHGL